MPYLILFFFFFFKLCHIWNHHSQICLNAKFREKMTMPKFGTKNALFGYFWTRIFKNYCHIWNQHLEFVKHESLTHTINFGIGSAFSKGLRSAFSEGLGPGPLYKACHLCVVLLFIATILGWFLYCSIDLAIGSSIWPIFTDLSWYFWGIWVWN